MPLAQGETPVERSKNQGKGIMSSISLEFDARIPDSLFTKAALR
jgi:hypothetical protein